MSLHELTQEFLARAAGVEIRGVYEVSARLAVGFIDFLRFSLWGSHPHSSPKVIVPSDASETRSPLLPSNLYFIIVLLPGFSNSGIGSALCHIQSAVEAPIFKHR